jgi:hypothetical protein
VTKHSKSLPKAKSATTSSTVKTAKKKGTSPQPGEGHAPSPAGRFTIGLDLGLTVRMEARRKVWRKLKTGAIQRPRSGGLTNTGLLMEALAVSRCGARRAPPSSTLMPAVLSFVYAGTSAAMKL